jgi:opacity protein-like surface antigen
VVVAPREAPQVYHYTPRPRIPHREWGLNLHLGGIAMGSGRSGDAAMGLIGLGLRFRPVPAFAIEANIDVAGGTDYNGFRRTETMGTMNALVYLNPKSRAQFYLLGGIGLSSARVSEGSDTWDTKSMYGGGYYSYGDQKYTYFGGQGGAGIEIRLSRVVALNFDVRGFVRSRVDNRGGVEFIDASGRTTNTSGGALVNGGITFYF